MNWLHNMLNSSHSTRSLILIGIPLALAIILIVGTGGVDAERGWPQNEQGEPANGGNWMGAGQLDIPPEDLHADWYNNTQGDTNWIIESGDDVLRSYSSFDFTYDLIIGNGGVLRLDSVTFIVNTTNTDHQVIVENGGALHISNSTFTVWDILVEEGGELHIREGNQSTYITSQSPNTPGITMSKNSLFTMENSSMGGPTTLLLIEDENAVIEGNSFSTSGSGEACIHLTASATISGNTFTEGAAYGSYAIIADESVSSIITENTFTRFRHGDQSTMGGAILSRGPLDIHDNIFEGMVMDTAQDPYIIHFIGSEPALHEGNPIWETNRYIGKTPGARDERVNIFKQSWTIDVEVLSSLNGEPYEGALVEIEDSSGFFVSSDLTDTMGHVIFELPEYIVTATDDGNTGDSDKETTDRDPYDITASLGTESSSIQEQFVPTNLELELTLPLIHHDVSITDITLPELITASESIQIVTDLEELGISGGSVFDLYLLVESTDALWSFELGSGEVVMEDSVVPITFDVTIPQDVPDGLFTVRASISFSEDQNSTNDELSSHQFAINQKPEVEIHFPNMDDEVDGTIMINGSALDDGSIDLVQIGIGGTWYDADGGEQWYYSLDTRIYPNGPLQISVRSRDDHGLVFNGVPVNISLSNGPTITITSPGDGTEIDGRNEVTLIGSALKHSAEISSVTLSIDGGPEFSAVPVSSWNQWTFDLLKGEVDLLNPLSDGEHTILATVTDDDGLTGFTSHTYIVHSTDPATDSIVVVTDPLSLNSDSSTIISSDTWISGTATDDYQIIEIEYRLNGKEWIPATESIGIGTSSATWRVLVSPNQLEIGGNILEIRSHDHDGNITRSVQFLYEAPSSDLTVTDVLLQDALGNSLAGSGIRIGQKITFIIYVGVTTEEIIPQVAVRVTVAGLDVGIRTQENVSGDFDMPISIIVTEKGSITYEAPFSVIVDPADIIVESDEHNNIFSGSLPPEDSDPDDDTTILDRLLDPIGPLPLIAYVGILVFVVIIGIGMGKGDRKY
jgi:hypothetical protein